jgi:hypothetical protein
MSETHASYSVGIPGTPVRAIEVAFTGDARAELARRSGITPVEQIGTEAARAIRALLRAHAAVVELAIAVDPYADELLPVQRLCQTLKPTLQSAALTLSRRTGQEFSASAPVEDGKDPL